MKRTRSIRSYLVPESLDGRVYSKVGVTTSVGGLHEGLIRTLLTTDNYLDDRLSRPTLYHKIGLQRTS